MGTPPGTTWLECTQPPTERGCRSTLGSLPLFWKSPLPLSPPIHSPASGRSSRATRGRFAHVRARARSPPPRAPRLPPPPTSRCPQAGRRHLPRRPIPGTPTARGRARGTWGAHSLRSPRQRSRPAPRLAGTAEPHSPKPRRLNRPGTRRAPSLPGPPPPPRLFPLPPHLPATTGSSSCSGPCRGSSAQPRRGHGAGSAERRRRRPCPLVRRWREGGLEPGGTPAPPAPRRTGDRPASWPAGSCLRAARSRVPLFVAGGEGLAWEPARRRGRRRVRGATGACPAQPPHESVLGREPPAAVALSLSPSWFPIFSQFPDQAPPAAAGLRPVAADSGFKFLNPEAPGARGEPERFWGRYVD